MVIMSLKLLQLPCRCCCCTFLCGNKSKCRSLCSLRNKEPPKMETENDAGRIEPAEIENKEPTRGRLKKRGKGKKRSTNKEPFSRIAPGVLPFAAIASASPNAINYIRKSRSPSPIATAVTFAGRIGKMIAAGEKLERSLSERDIYRKSGSELAQSKQMSKSLPGPSTFSDPAMDMETEVGYETVGDVRGKALAMLKSQDDDDDDDDEDEKGFTPVMKRGELPLPDEGSGGKEDAMGVSDLYAKVVRHGTVRSKVEEHGQELVDDSDDLTTVTEEDEEASSRISLFKSKMKYQAAIADDFIDGPSDRDAYRLPFDAITSEDHPKRKFEAIEELECEDLSGRNRNGMVSPASARGNEDSSRGSARLQTSHRSRSAQSMDSEHRMRDLRHQAAEELSSQSSTPRELGREAALRRLEELGFDGISKEFGIFPPSDQEHHENYSRHPRQISKEEEAVLPIVSHTEESTPLFDNFEQLEGSENPEERMPTPSYGSRDQAKLSKMPSRRVLVEEPKISFMALSDQQSSQELMLDELVDDRQNGEWMDETASPNAAKDTVNMSDSIKSASVSPMEHKSSVQLSKRLSAAEQQDRRNQSNGSQNSQKEFTSKRNLEERGPNSRPTSISPRQSHDISGHSEDSPRRNSSYDSRILQKQMHEEIQQKQDRILNTISSLQEKFDSVAKSTVSDKMETEDEEKLLLLRQLIKEEQKKYHEQQKMLEEQEEKFLKAKERMSARKRLPSTPVPHQKASSRRRSKSPFKEERSDHARVLENQLTNVEAERKALLDLNSSLQDENNTLRKLAFNSDVGDTSGIVFKKQNAELIETNKNLKSLVHRLNIELSRYQAKYRPPRREEVDGLSLPEEGPIPEWLVNMKYLSPLIMAYDDRLKEKSDVIRAYEANLASIKARMLEVVRENQRLHLMNNESSNDDSAIDVNEWNLLQEHARLVVEENSILMQEIELKDRRIDEMQEEFDLEIDKLTKKIRILANEVRNAQRNVSSLQIDNEVSMKRCKEAEIESSMKITEEEVEQRIEKIRRPLLEKIQGFEKYKDNAETRFQAVLKEKQELALRLTDTNAIASQLHLELDLVRKSQRKVDKKVIVLQKKLDAAKEKEFIATDTLAQVLSVAEKNSSERDEFARMIETQNNETMRNYKQLIEEERKLDHLRKEVEKYKKLAKKNAAEVLVRVQEKDEEIAEIQNSHDREVSSLKDIIRNRQMLVDRFQSDKGEVEKEIDGLWKTITEENEGFKSLNK